MIRGHRNVGSEPTDVPFALSLPFDNLGEGGNAAEPDIVIRQETIRLSGFTVGFAPGAWMMPFTAAKLGAVQGSAIVIVGEKWGAESALIMGPGKRLWLR
jgi:hypothetical protein